jgi:hypothetical protein
VPRLVSAAVPPSTLGAAASSPSASGPPASSRAAPTWGTGCSSASLAPPQHGYRAFFVEIRWRGLWDRPVFAFSTPAFVVPDICTLSRYNMCDQNEATHCRILLHAHDLKSFKSLFLCSPSKKARVQDDCCIKAARVQYLSICRQVLCSLPGLPVYRAKEAQIAQGICSKKTIRKESCIITNAAY